MLLGGMDHAEYADYIAHLTHTAELAAADESGEEVRRDEVA